MRRKSPIWPYAIPSTDFIALRGKPSGGFAAQYCDRIDSDPHPSIAGTIAGYDTAIVLPHVPPSAAARDLCAAARTELAAYAPSEASAIATGRAVLVHCADGKALGVARELDAARLQGWVGCVAGDSAVLALPQEGPSASAKRVAARLSDIVSSDSRVLGLETSGSFVIVRTDAERANEVGVGLDKQVDDGKLGPVIATLSGIDTILIPCGTRKPALNLSPWVLASLIVVAYVADMDLEDAHA